MKTLTETIRDTVLRVSAIPNPVVNIKRTTGKTVERYIVEVSRPKHWESSHRAYAWYDQFACEADAPTQADTGKIETGGDTLIVFDSKQARDAFVATRRKFDRTCCAVSGRDAVYIVGPQPWTSPYVEHFRRAAA